ncbi:MAG: DUF971 domain-containing protein [Myxococcales bacterium]|nr:DUF971 domain-containing protein [Myxococcales bacterium]
MGDPRYIPIEVRAPRGADVTEVLFDDGHTAVLPHQVLRGFCPCASCQGHSGGVRFVADGDRDLIEIGEVGNYALRLTWGDGHSTGIYSFRFLRQLCACSECCHGDATEREFGRTP